MKQYTVVKKATRDDLMKRVNQLITEGWKPAGGICVDGGMFYQAMTK